MLVFFDFRTHDVLHLNVFKDDVVSTPVDVFDT